MDLIDNDVDVRASEDGSSGRIVAVVIGLMMLTAAGFDDSGGAYEVAQLVMGGLLIGAGSLAPYIVQIVTHIRGTKTVGQCDTATIAAVHDRIAIEDEKIEAALAALESSSSCLAMAASRLRGGRRKPS